MNVWLFQRQQREIPALWPTHASPWLPFPSLEAYRGCRDKVFSSTFLSFITSKGSPPRPHLYNIASSSLTPLASLYRDAEEDEEETRERQFYSFEKLNFKASPNSLEATDEEASEYALRKASPIIKFLRNMFLPKNLSHTPDKQAPKGIWVRGRLQALRCTRSGCFAILRFPKGQTLQTCIFPPRLSLFSENTTSISSFPPSPSFIYDTPTAILQALKKLPLESCIDVYGYRKKAEVHGCTLKDTELHILRLEVVASPQAHTLPFLPLEAARSDIDPPSTSVSNRFPRVGSTLRWANRWLDLRTPQNQAIQRIKAGLVESFRGELRQHFDFMEIFSPKLMGSPSEVSNVSTSGTGVFQTHYFGKIASLAQSPQLYKQMGIASDFGRVFEVGPVFRAEVSHTRRHLCEYTSMDLEMELYDSYEELLYVCYSLLKRMLHRVETLYSEDLRRFRDLYPPARSPFVLPDTPCILTYTQALRLLSDVSSENSNPSRFSFSSSQHPLAYTPPRKPTSSLLPPTHIALPPYNHTTQPNLRCLSPTDERRLGYLVKSLYNSDVVLLTHFPLSMRPFYTMAISSSPSSYGFDILFRGIEIASGSQREHRYALLKPRLHSQFGSPLPPLLDCYLKAFQQGCPPHGGAAFGLERLLMAFLQLDSIKKAAFIPRTPTRLVP
ncbi:aspartate-tRna ligase [Cardiosporidium cionae]|uniref:aspartate--tRNA ligase n=1 Tax=Cardiosporidium cionae TaxID=476202 RepID=A0ABQ7J696_9APIC|nr:aspartate-tRna ligase [Cardiosporidium cionae]|eukprot:KAF8819449.1 aspartate-tRna ligase [Cardiosporidium cionae]